VATDLILEWYISDPWVWICECGIRGMAWRYVERKYWVSGGPFFTLSDHNLEFSILMSEFQCKSFKKNKMNKLITISMLLMLSIQMISQKGSFVSIESNQFRFSENSDYYAFTEVESSELFSGKYIQAKNKNIRFSDYQIEESGKLYSINDPMSVEYFCDKLAQPKTFKNENIRFSDYEIKVFSESDKRSQVAFSSQSSYIYWHLNDKTENIGSGAKIGVQYKF